jgi:autotransporter-associated beta strand protein
LTSSAANRLNVKSGATFALSVGGTGEFSTANVATVLTNQAASTGATNGMNAGSNFGFDTTNASGASFTIGNVIANSTGAGGGARGLTKLGTGTLVLSVSNTYTGPTQINGGTLLITGAAQSTSAITFGGGNLGLDIATPVTAASATVNFTGQTVLVTGTPTLPSHTLLTATSMTGTPTLAAPISGYTLQVVSNQLRLVAGSANPYDTWAGPGVAFDADANNDGVDNGMAWVLGAANASANALPLLPTMDNTSDPDFFIFTYRRSDTANTAPNTTLSVQYGSMLLGWTPAVAGPDIIITPTNDGAGAGIDLVQVKIRRTLAMGGKLFSRLNVATTP